jgi:hypothetical protein
VTEANNRANPDAKYSSGYAICNFYFAVRRHLLCRTRATDKRVRRVCSKNLKGRTELKDLGADWLIDSGDNVRFHVLIAVTKNIIVSYLRRAVC